jgi:hypothetical protein
MLREELFETIHYAALADLAESHNIHVFALNETWLTPKLNSTSAEIFDAIPHGFTFSGTPHLVPDTSTFSVVGGGIAFMI